MFNDVPDIRQRLGKRLAQVRADELTAALMGLLEQEDFRKYMWHVLSWCRVMDKSMHTDAKIMAFREGQRDIGIRIMQDIMNVRPSAYEQMRVEHTKQAEEDEAMLDKAVQKEGEDYGEDV